MAGSNRNPNDDRVLRRLRYAAGLVALLAFGLLLSAYIVAYATRDSAPAPDGPLLVIVLTALLIFLGLKVPDVDLGSLVGKLADPPPPPAPKDDERDG